MQNCGEVTIFDVVKVKDWRPVAVYLMATALGDPVEEVNEDIASKTKSELWKRVDAVMADPDQVAAFLRVTVAVRFRGAMLISLVMTAEPGGVLHLCMQHILPSGGSHRLPDHVAQEVAMAILGTDKDERLVGLDADIRHFFKTRTPN